MASIDPVGDFEALVLQLISEITRYSALAEQDPETEGNIQKVRTLTQALNGAVMSVANRPQRVVFPGA